MKPGYQSTEFYVIVGTAFFLAWASQHGYPIEKAVEWVMMMSGGYVANRWHLKTIDAKKP